MTDYYLTEIEKYIGKLETSSFVNWTDDEKKGYLTTCKSIKEKVKATKNTSRLDVMEE